MRALRAALNEYLRLGLNYVARRTAYLAADDAQGSRRARYERLRPAYNEYWRLHEKAARAERAAARWGGVAGGWADEASMAEEEGGGVQGQQQGRRRRRRRRQRGGVGDGQRGRSAAAAVEEERRGADAQGRQRRHGEEGGGAGGTTLFGGRLRVPMASGWARAWSDGLAALSGGIRGAASDVKHQAPPRARSLLHFGAGQGAWGIRLAPFNPNTPPSLLH